MAGDFYVWLFIAKAVLSSIDLFAFAFDKNIYFARLGTAIENGSSV